MYWLMYRAGI